MEKITTINGIAIPLAMNDVDTDLIIPAQYLTSTSKEGYGVHLFARLKESDENFPLNQDKFQQGNILITQHNFGCGSSREHAVWALKQAGIQAIIAHSFADIFYNNSAKNGLVLIKLPEMTVKSLLQSAASGQYQLTIDLLEQKIHSSHDEVVGFEIDPFHRYCFINGLDDLQYLFARREIIAQYRKQREPYHFLSTPTSTAEV